MSDASKHRCTIPTKAGEPCKGTPIAETEFRTCLAHAPGDVRERLGFGGAQEGAGRPRNPKVIEVLRERVDERVDEVLDVLFNALQADRGIALAIKGGGMEIGYSPDHETRIKAAKEILDRGYGKARQVAEISGPEGGPIEHVGIPTDADFQQGLAEVLAAAGATNGNGNGSS